MRLAQFVPLAVFSAGAVAAEPSLKCSFEGNKYSVVIVNPDAKDVQCSYACNFTLEGGMRSISGSIGVKAGETKTADEDATRGKLTGVRSSSLDCK